MGADSWAENTPNATEFICPSPKVLNFIEKRLHSLGVRSPWPSSWNHQFHSFMCYYDLLWFIIRVLSRLSRCPNLRISFSNSSHIELKGRFLIHYFLWLFSNICKIYLGDVSSTLSILRNRRRAGNKYRSWKIWQKFEVFCNEKTGENYFSDFWYYI